MQTVHYYRSLEPGARSQVLTVHYYRSMEPGARSQVVTCRSLAVLGHRGEGQEDTK